MVKSDLKTIFTLAVIALLGIGTFSCQKEEEKKDNKPVNYGDYVDLGLPSGTLWKSKNELNPKDTAYNLYTFDEAAAAFGDKVPTQEQMNELIKQCTCTWDGNGYNVVGSNGNSIYLPGVGVRYCDGTYGAMGKEGLYWSSTKYLGGGYYLYFLANTGVYIHSHNTCNAGSIRLVKKK